MLIENAAFNGHYYLFVLMVFSWLIHGCSCRIHWFVKPWYTSFNGFVNSWHTWFLWFVKSLLPLSVWVCHVLTNLSFHGLSCCRLSMHWLVKCTSWLSNSYTMDCPPVREDNPRALASGLSYVQVDKHGIPILYHLHQCRPCTSSDISC